MRWARQPLVDDPLRRDGRAPGEVLAEDGTARAGGQCPARDGAVGEVLAAHHVRGVAPGRANETEIHSQGSETATRPDAVDRPEERRLRARRRPGLSSGGRTRKGENCQKNSDNLAF